MNRIDSDCDVLLIIFIGLVFLNLDIVNNVFCIKGFFVNCDYFYILWEGLRFIYGYFNL